MVEKQEKENGRIKWFNQEKGYGIILCDDGELCFFQFRSVTGKGFPEFKTSQQVEFIRQKNLNGTEAHNVTLI